LLFRGRALRQAHAKLDRVALLQSRLEVAEPVEQRQDRREVRVGRGQLLAREGPRLLRPSLQLALDPRLAVAVPGEAPAPGRDGADRDQRQGRHRGAAQEPVAAFAGEVAARQVGFAEDDLLQQAPQEEAAVPVHRRGRRQGEADVPRHRRHQAVYGVPACVPLVR
jgi:hypothetical protein